MKSASGELEGVPKEMADLERTVVVGSPYIPSPSVSIALSFVQIRGLMYCKPWTAESMLERGQASFRKRKITEHSELWIAQLQQSLICGPRTPSFVMP
jgi:hypothetical protein